MASIPAAGTAASAEANPPDELPRTLGRYTLFELVGQGGMAQIYLARAETAFGATRLAVVKRILPAFAEDPRFAEMLIHEAKLAARLSHKHIAQVFDLGREKSDLYIAMEYVEGFDLNALLRKCSEEKVALPVEFALGIVADVLEGLDYAHRRVDESNKSLSIVHRDVSPSNILVSLEGEVKLCDFGIAHANDLVEERANNEALKGKAGYMSPEHARGEALDARADVFATGIILWELLAGRRLYRTKAETSLLEQARAAEIPPLSGLEEKGVPKPEALERIVRRALARDREERYASAGELLRDLETYLADAGLLASRLKLGEWLSSSFGAELAARRRASEARLPKSSSERVRAAADEPGSAIVPTAQRAPRGNPYSSGGLPVSEGAMRAFRNELEQSEPSVRVSFEPGSLAGASLDVSQSSQTALDPNATGRSSETDLARRRASDKRGRILWISWVVITVMSVVAALVALARLLVR